MPGSKVKVVIYESSANELRVDPPAAQLDFVAGAGNADELVIKNRTKEPISVYISAGAFATEIAEVIKVGEKKVLPCIQQLGPLPMPGVVTANSYALLATGLKSGRKAIGNSDPVIIVEN